MTLNDNEFTQSLNGKDSNGFNDILADLDPAYYSSADEYVEDVSIDVSKILGRTITPAEVKEARWQWREVQRLG